MIIITKIVIITESRQVYAHSYRLSEIEISDARTNSTWKETETWAEPASIIQRSRVDVDSADHLSTEKWPT